MLVELGYPAESLAVCADADEVARAAAEGSIALVADGSLLPAAPWDILVEATGNPADGYAMAREALTGGRHVAMVSKEVDSVAGLHLADLARDHGVVYTTADGDQLGQPHRPRDLGGAARPRHRGDRQVQRVRPRPRPRGRRRSPSSTPRCPLPSWPDC